MVSEPILRQSSDLVHGSRFFEEVRRSRDDLETGLTGEELHRVTVELNHDVIQRTDNQQGWLCYGAKTIAGKIRSPPSGNNRHHGVRAHCCSNERGGRTRAGPEQSKGRILRRELFHQQIGQPDDTRREQADVKPEMAAVGIDLLLFQCKEIGENGSQSGRLQFTRDELIARAATSATAPVRKQHDSPGSLRHHKLGLEHHTVNREVEVLALTFELIHLCSDATASILFALPELRVPWWSNPTKEGPWNADMRSAHVKCLIQRSTAATTVGSMETCQATWVHANAVIPNARELSNSCSLIAKSGGDLTHSLLESSSATSRQGAITR